MNSIHSDLIRKISNCQMGSEEAVKQLFEGRFFDKDVRDALIFVVTQRFNDSNEMSERLLGKNDSIGGQNWLKISNQWQQCLDNLVSGLPGIVK